MTRHSISMRVGLTFVGVISDRAISEKRLLVEFEGVLGGA